MAVIPSVHTYLKAFRFRINGAFLRLFITMSGGKVGANLKCATFPIFKISPRANILIGNNVAIGRNVSFEITETGKLTLEGHVTIGDNVVFSSMSEILVKKYCSVAENVVIRGSFHHIKKGVPVAMQKNFTMPVVIGEDCLLGSGTIVLWGTEIPNGCIIGAHSVVTNKVILKENGIYAGNILKYIGSRDERTEG